MTRARETSENARQAKAWVNFDGTFGSSPFTLANGGMRSAFNVSSITDNGTGDYTINFTTAFPDSNFAVSATLGYSYAAPNYGSWCATPKTYSTSSLRLVLTRSDDIAVDGGFVNVIVFR